MVLTIAPMAVKYTKKKFSYEIRKLVHYLALAIMVSKHSSSCYAINSTVTTAQCSWYCTVVHTDTAMLTIYVCVHLLLSMLLSIHVYMQVALACHSPVLTYFCSALLVWWALDVLYMYVFQTYLIENPIYEPIGLGTSVRFEVPPHFK
jgi:hypothetical protein